MLRELGFDAVTHGFRSSFRDYAAEQTHTPHAVMEAALAHSNRSVVPVRGGRFQRLSERFQSFLSGRSQMSFLGLS